MHFYQIPPCADATDAWTRNGHYRHGYAAIDQQEYSWADRRGLLTLPTVDSGLILEHFVVFLDWVCNINSKDPGHYFSKSPEVAQIIQTSFWLRITPQIPYLGIWKNSPFLSQTSPKEIFSIALLSQQR